MPYRGEAGLSGIKPDRHRGDPRSPWASWMRRDARKSFVARPGSLPVFSSRDSTGKSPRRCRDHREGTGTTRESVFITVPNRLTPVVPDVDYGNHESAWSPRFTRVHYGSLGLGTVDRGVALRKHPGRPRLTPGVRGGVRQRPEASRCIAGGTPVVTAGTGWFWRKYGWSRS